MSMKAWICVLCPELTEIVSTVDRGRLVAGCAAASVVPTASTRACRVRVDRARSDTERALDTIGTSLNDARRRDAGAMSAFRTGEPVLVSLSPKRGLVPCLDGLVACSPGLYAPQGVQMRPVTRV